MFIAKKYKETNIVEYVLYMWHIEELIRSFNLDMRNIEANVISAFKLEEDALNQVRSWYTELIKQMEDEGIRERGHLSDLRELMTELVYLHQSLMTVYQDKAYQSLVAEAQPNIEAVKEKTFNKNRTEIEFAMEALFGVLVLKLKKKQVSEATQEAVKSISRMMAHLAKQYHAMKAGNLNLPKVMEN